MVQIEIFVKEVGKEPVQVSVSGTDTAETIREVLQLGDTKIRLKQRRLKKGDVGELRRQDGRHLNGIRQQPGSQSVGDWKFCRLPGQTAAEIRKSGVHVQA